MSCGTAALVPGYCYVSMAAPESWSRGVAARSGACGTTESLIGLAAFRWTGHHPRLLRKTARPEPTPDTYPRWSCASGPPLCLLH
jgi:hypothetical protein